MDSRAASFAAKSMVAQAADLILRLGEGCGDDDRALLQVALTALKKGQAGLGEEAATKSIVSFLQQSTDCDAPGVKYVWGTLGLDKSNSFRATDSTDTMLSPWPTGVNALLPSKPEPFAGSWSMNVLSQARRGSITGPRPTKFTSLIQALENDPVNFERHRLSAPREVIPAFVPWDSQRAGCQTNASGDGAGDSSRDGLWSFPTLKKFKDTSMRNAPSLTDELLRPTHDMTLPHVISEDSYDPPVNSSVDGGLLVILGANRTDGGHVSSLQDQHCKTLLANMEDWLAGPAHETLSPLPSDMHRELLVDPFTFEDPSQSERVSEPLQTAWPFDALRRHAIRRMLDSTRSWNDINPFKIDVMTNGHALSMFSYAVVTSSPRLSELQINFTAFARFCGAVEARYSRAPYHSAVHVAHVMMSLQNCLWSTLLGEFLDAWELLALYIATMCHDIGHRGSNASFQASVGSMASCLFGQNSPMERTHFSVANVLLRQHAPAFLPQASQADINRLQEYVTRLVLATDMQKHVRVMQEFLTMSDSLGEGLLDALLEESKNLPISALNLFHSDSARQHPIFAMRESDAEDTRLSSCMAACQQATGTATLLSVDGGRDARRQSRSVPHKFNNFLGSFRRSQAQALTPQALRTSSSVPHHAAAPRSSIAPRPVSRGLSESSCGGVEVSVGLLPGAPSHTDSDPGSSDCLAALRIAPISSCASEVSAAHPVTGQAGALMQNRNSLDELSSLSLIAIAEGLAALGDKRPPATRVRVHPMCSAADTEESSDVCESLPSLGALPLACPGSHGGGHQAAVSRLFGRPATGSCGHSVGPVGSSEPGSGENGDDALHRMYMRVLMERTTSENRISIMQVLLKCADVGHTASPLPMHKAWLQRLDEELFRQGDIMKTLPDVPVPAVMDRSAGTALSSSQVPFYDTVILPMYEAFEALLPRSSYLLDGAEANFKHWQEVAQANAQTCKSRTTSAASGLAQAQ